MACGYLRSRARRSVGSGTSARTLRRMDKLTMILDARPAVDGWVSRGRAVEIPQPGSELSEDDTLWRWLPMSELARVALVAASEHLQLVGECVERRRLYVTASHTALRAALLGAASAVWLLGPTDSQERRQRGLRSASEWYRRKAQADEILLDSCPPDQRAQLSLQIEHSQDRCRESRSLWMATDTLTARESPNATKVIDWVAGSLFAEDQNKQTNLRLHWAALSGDAHALGWQLLSRRTAPMTRTDTRLHETAVRSEIDHVADPYMAAFTVSRRGWSLFDQRCSED
jgi:hypothetical protein